ncbi:hypothetical protein RYX36_033258, partial [Vicia faba]
MNIGTCSILRFQFPIWNFRKPLISTRFNMRLLSVRNSSASSIATTTTEPTNSKKNEPWLIVGLGNPGKKYAATRHNVGFEMVDAIAEAEGISMSSVSFKALFGKGFIGDVPVLLAKPQTFMNASGESVGFEMVDAIAEAEGISMGFIGDVPLLLAKPQTFMNASGESVLDDHQEKWILSHSFYDQFTKQKREE